MDPKGKGMVVNDNEKESIFNEPKETIKSMTPAQVKTRKTERRRGASGRLSTTIATNLPLLKRTTNTRIKRK
jgi:hypothetical protein